MVARFGSTRRRLVVLGAVAILAAVGALVGLGLGGTAKTLTLPTTGAYAPIAPPKPIVPTYNGTGAIYVDPDSMIRQGQDLLMNLAPGRQLHSYRLTITNVSSVGMVNSFDWVPPNGVQIVRVLGSSAGTCTATGTQGFGGNQFKTAILDPKIVCTGVNLKAPTCTCRGDGGKVTISFVASATMMAPGATRIDTATPSLKIIPSYVQTPDLPTCRAGQQSTPSSPCKSA